MCVRFICCRRGRSRIEKKNMREREKNKKKS